MRINKAIKRQIHVTKPQLQSIVNHCGCSRFMYNLRLNALKTSIENKGKYEKGIPIKELKKIEEYLWLNEVHSKVLQQAEKDFVKTKTKMFKSMKNHEFISLSYRSKRNHNSFRLSSQEVSFADDVVCVKPKIFKGLQFKIKKSNIPANAKINSVTISIDNLNKVYASVQFEQERQIKTKTNKDIGIDAGIKTIATTSDHAIKYDYAIRLKENQDELKRLNQLRDKKKKNSCRRRKINFRIAKIHKKIADTRKTSHHQFTSMIINNHDAIYVESLDVKSWIGKNKHFNAAIHDAAIGMMLSQLSYKAKHHGRQLIAIDKYYPSSKACYQCGHVKDVLHLNERTYECHQCGFEIDRDYNAALNIQKEGRRLLKINEMTESQSSITNNTGSAISVNGTSSNEVTNCDETYSHQETLVF